MTVSPNQWETPASPQRAAEYQRLAGLVEQAIDASLAPATRLAYQSGWAHWVQFCRHWGQPVLPVTTEALTAFLVDRAHETVSGRPRWKASTLDMWVAAIVGTNGLHGHPDPTEDETFRKARRGVRRHLTTRPSRKRPLTIDQITTVLESLEYRVWPAGIAAARDAAILLAGIAGIGRRSELVALNIGDLTSHDDGLHVLIRRSKTDQTGEGQIKFLPYGQHVITCGPCALHHWLHLVELADGYAERRSVRGTANPDASSAAAQRFHQQLRQLVYNRAHERHVCHTPLPPVDPNKPPRPLFRPITRTGHIVTPFDEPHTGRTSTQNRKPQDRARLSGTGLNLIVKLRLTEAGIITDATRSQYASHSLRAGFVTEALRAGATTREVMRQTGHTSESTVAIYDREHNPGRNNAVNALGL